MAPKKSLIVWGDFFSSFEENHEAKEDFLLDFEDADGVGFDFESFVHGISVSFVFVAIFFVLLLTLDIVDGSGRRGGCFGLEPQLGSDILGHFQLLELSDTLAFARLGGESFLNGFSLDRLQPSSAIATLANAINIRPPHTTHRRLLTAFTPVCERLPIATLGQAPRKRIPADCPCRGIHT